MPNIRLSDAEKNQIADAVAEAEKKTSGEIVTAVISQSYDYALYELIYAIVCGFVYFVVVMFFSGNIQTWLENTFWDYNIQYLLAFYGFTTFLIIAVFYFLFNLPFLDRLIIPQRVKAGKVKERALRYFMESGVYNTRDRTGILIFISLLEKKVELVADSGIDARIEPGQWQQVVDNVIAGIKGDNFAGSLIEAVNACGNILQRHFPIRSDDSNELKNDLTILEE
ncbi:MAG: TPM domain-containing protein [Candidatus Cloacimonetes bacterium]|nr:TPM domain-containing protein [Candidatus Cloacimonadota bacterium]